MDNKELFVICVSFNTLNWVCIVVFGYGKFCGVCYWIIDGLITVKLWENKLLFGQILSWEDLKLHILWCLQSVEAVMYSLLCF